MNTNVVPEPGNAFAPRRRSVLLISFCTLISAAAQILMKVGMSHVTKLDSIALATNVPLVAGYALYGVFCLMMILALRQGAFFDLSDYLAGLCLGDRALLFHLS